MQGIVAINTRAGAMAPILSDHGIASTLAGGAFLQRNPTENYLDESSRKLVQIMALSEFFKAIVSHLHIPVYLLDQTKKRIL